MSDNAQSDFPDLPDAVDETTAAAMPRHIRDLYAEGPDWQAGGKIPLRYVRKEDTANWIRHAELIASRRVRVLEQNETPASIAAAEREAAASEAAFKRILGDMQHEDDARRVAALEARQQAERKRFNEELDRLRNRS